MTIKDAAGRVFDGVESVALDWRLSDGQLGSLSSPTGTLRAQHTDYLQPPGRPYQTLQVEISVVTKKDIDQDCPELMRHVCVLHWEEIIIR